MHGRDRWRFEVLLFLLTGGAGLQIFFPSEDTPGARVGMGKAFRFHDSSSVIVATPNDCTNAME